MNRAPSIASRTSSPVPRAPLFVLAVLAGAAAAQETPGAGKVVFVSGAAQLVGADGRSRALATGTEIRQGDQVVTARDAYVHLRMVDNAFVAVRPESRLFVQLYDYQSNNPSASRIKLQLESGATRTVSGKGGEAAKQNYRFNTPMAAIGLRGTDYTVVSTPQETRVSVSRGAVAVTPLGDGCAAAALGPCATATTRDLSAGIPHAYLQVSSAERIPVLVKPEHDPQTAGGQSPGGRSDEPRGDRSGDLHLAGSKDAASQVAADRLATGLLPVEPPPPPQLVWGRWSNYAQGEGAPSVAELLPGRDITYGNQVFGLLRQQGKVSLPAQGGVDFKIAGAEAYLINGSQIDPARVAGGKLNIDFTQRSFTTSLAVHHAGGTEQLQAKGAVQWQGNLIADRALSNMNMAGVVSNGASEAAYLFDKALTSGGLLGAVRWVR